MNSHKSLYVTRYLGKLKKYVKNKNRPEGCIVEGYLVEECLSFYSMYLKDVDSTHNWSGWNTDAGGHSIVDGLPILGGFGKSVGKSSQVPLKGDD